MKKKIEAIEIKTGKVVYFDSLKSCAEKLGCSIGMINKVLSSSEIYKYYRSAKGYSLAYAAESEEL